MLETRVKIASIYIFNLKFCLSVLVKINLKKKYVNRNSKVSIPS